MLSSPTFCIAFFANDSEAMVNLKEEQDIVQITGEVVQVAFISYQVDSSRNAPAAHAGAGSYQPRYDVSRVAGRV